MQQRRLADLRVGAIGLGAMPLSTDGRPDTATALRTVHEALEMGVTLIDTADAYGTSASEVGHNERLIAEALRTYAGDASAVLVATKGGVLRRDDGGWRFDGSPEHLRSACDASLRALGVECIGLYQLHRPDPSVPYAESVGALAELQSEGKVRLIGLSNVDVHQVDAALEVVDVVSVQNHWSPDHRAGEDDLRMCVERNLAFLPWRPLGGRAAASLAQAHPAFGEVAHERGVSPQQVCLAWMLAKSEYVIPIPGARRPGSVRDSAQAADLQLSVDDLRRLDGDGRREHLTHTASPIEE